MKSLTLIPLFCAALYGQSCAVTSPTNGQLVQSIATFPLTLSLTSAPSAYGTDWLIDNINVGTGFFTDTHPAIVAWEEQWPGMPFAIQWAPGLQGDGLKTATAYVFDVNGNLLTYCSQAFTVRVEGMSSQTLTVPTSGKSSPMTMTTFNGTNLQYIGETFNIDGFNINNSASPTFVLSGANNTTSATNGFQIPTFNTTLWPNGKHWLFGNTGLACSGCSPPFFVSSTVSSVSGTTINTTANHYVNQGSIVTFANTGGGLPMPLNAGAQCYGQGSGQCTATVTVSGGNITTTTSASTMATVGTPIYLRNINQTNQMTGAGACDGIYTAISPTSGTTITVAAPAGCPNGAIQEYNFEVYVNPYCVTTGSGSSLSVSATFTNPTRSDNYPTCGSPLSLSGGSGTTQFATRLHSRYWGGTDDFPNVGGNVAYIAQKVDIENGMSVPMRSNAIYWEVPLVVGQTVNLCNPATLIQNTDLSFTSTACNALAWNPVADGGISPASLVATVSTSSTVANVTGVGAGWMQINVVCSACTGGVTLPTQTIYVHVFSSAITFPSYTSCGALANAYNMGLPAGCRSHYLRSLWLVGNPYYYAPPPNNAYTSYWEGTSLQNSNVNTVENGFTVQTSLSDPAATSCPNWSTIGPPFNGNVPEMSAWEVWAAQYGLGIEFDMDTIWRPGGTPNYASLAAILNNTGYNRSGSGGCLQALLAHMKSGPPYLYPRKHLDDEYTFAVGNILRPNSQIGGALTSIVVAGSVTTFNFAYISNQCQNTMATSCTGWTQSTGVGNWLQIISATHTCLNGWYPMNSVTNGGYNNNTYTVSITSTNNGGCANATYAPASGTVETTAQFIINPNPASSVQNISALPGDLSQTQTCWSGVGCTASGHAIGPTITASGCNISIPWTGNNLLAGATIRIWGATSANLNGVLPITSGAGVSPVTATYTGATGQACPTGTSFTVGTDPTLYITVDPYNSSITNGWGPNPLGQVYAIMAAVANEPTDSFSALGSTLTLNTIPTVVSFEGAPNATNSFLYNDDPNPAPILGIDGTVGDWGIVFQPTVGLATRAYQQYPRSFLYSTLLNYQKYCLGYLFVPGCDKPQQLFSRPETLIAQRAGMYFLGARGDRNYNYNNDTNEDYARGLGWSDGGAPNGWINQATSPRQWHGGMALYNSYVALREDTDLQPEAPKLNLDRNFFLTDAHTSATYGNSLSILCLSERPYGSQTVTLPQISGGSTLKYVLTGTTLQVSVLAGNPTSDTDDHCAWPGTAGANAVPAPARITVYVSQPPGYTAITQQTFSAPATLPYGAASMAIRVGYDPAELRHEPAVACYPNCTLALDYHSINLYIQRLYLNSANLPIDPNPPYQTLTSQGLP